MKGWVLVENNKIVILADNSIKVFKTKLDLFDYYGGGLGDLNSVQRVELKLLEGNQK
jgi:hypothetical protein